MHGQEPLAIESKEGAFARFKGFLDSLNAHLGRVAGLKNTRDDFNIVFLEPIESEVLIGRNQLTIGAQFMITPLTSPFGHLAVEPLAIANHWSQQLQWPAPADCLVQGGQQLLASLRLDGNSTVGALQDSQSGVQQADEVVHLGHGGHRALTTTPGGSLLNTDRRWQPRDEIHIRPGHRICKLASVGTHRVQEPTLPFGEQNIEGEGALAGATDPGHHHELPARDIHGDVAQIVLARPLDADDIRRHGGVFQFLRHSLRMVLLWFSSKRSGTPLFDNP